MTESPRGRSTRVSHSSVDTTAPLVVPAVIRHHDDEFECRWPELGLVLHVDVVHESRDGVSAEVTVRRQNGDVMVQRRTNLLSSQARTSLVRELGEINSAAPWPTLLDQAANAVLRTLRAIPAVTNLTTLAVPDDPVYLDETALLALSEVNLCYAPSESLKSMVVSALLAAGTYNVQLGPIKLSQSVRPLYLDWEDRAEIRAATVQAILRGAGVSAPTARFPHLPMTRPLHELVKPVRALIRAEGVTLALVDSFVPAAGPDPETATAMQRLYHALRNLDDRLTSCLIDHMTKIQAQEEKVGTAFGSTMVKALVRSEWRVFRGDNDSFVRRADGQDEWTQTVGIVQTKKSIGRKTPRFGLAITFIGPDLHRRPAREIRFAPAAFEADAGLVRRLSIPERIEHLLTQHARTVADLAANLGTTPNMVRAELSRMQRQGRAVLLEQGHGKISGTWGLASSREEPS